MFSLALVPLLVNIAAVDASGAAPSRWELDASAATATPAVLPQGLGLGAMIEGKRRLRGGPAFVSARLGWTQASAANVNWIIDHHQFVAAAGAGIDAHLGAGRLWAQAGAGAGVLYEILSRHQSERIDAANVPGSAERSVNLGPYFFGEAGVSVRMRDSVAAFVAGGPVLSRAVVSGNPLWRLGGAARLGVAYEF